MRYLFRFGLISGLLGAFLACDSEQEIGSPEIRVSALVEEEAVDSDDIRIIEGHDALMRRIEELRRSSAVFSASVEGAFAGIVSSGDRRELSATSHRDEEGCSTEMVSSTEIADSAAALSNVVAFGDPSSLRTLRERIHAGVSVGDMEVRDEEASLSPPKEEPVLRPFHF